MSDEFLLSSNLNVDQIITNPPISDDLKKNIINNTCVRFSNSTSYVEYRFESLLYISKVVVIPGGGDNKSHNITLEGKKSLNDPGWKTIRKFERIGIRETVTHEVNDKYQSLRIKLSGRGGYGWVPKNSVLCRFSVYSIDMSRVLLLDSNQKIKRIDGSIISELAGYEEATFLEYGMNFQELSKTDFSQKFTEKHYIQRESTPLGEGKVFEQPLDIDKIIKKVTIK